MRPRAMRTTRSTPPLSRPSAAMTMYGSQFHTLSCDCIVFRTVCRASIVAATRTPGLRTPAGGLEGGDAQGAYEDVNTPDPTAPLISPPLGENPNRKTRLPLTRTATMHRPTPATRALLGAAALAALACAAPSALAISVQSERVGEVQLFSKSAAKSIHIDAGTAAYALEVNLGPFDLDGVDRSDPSAIGAHRSPPSAFAGDLGPQLDWETNDSGGASAAVTVVSPEATSIRLAVVITAPEGTVLRIFDASGAQSGHTHSVEAADQGRALWLPSATGDTATLEISLANADDASTVTLYLEKVAHRWGDETSASASGVLSTKNAQSAITRSVDPNRALATVRNTDNDNACQFHVPLACSTNAEARFLADAVVNVVVENANRTSSCTATLINSETPDGATRRPFLLTATHCVDSHASAATVETIWFKRSARCELESDYHPQATRLPGGAWLRHRSEEDDTALLQLKSPPPPGAVYAGWTTDTPYVGQDVFLIGHPQGTRAKYTEGRIIRTVDFPISTNPGVLIEDGLVMSWTHGTTEPGNSGSPLFTRQGHITGVLIAQSPISCGQNVTASAAPFDNFHPKVARWLGGDERSPDQLGRLRSHLIAYLPPHGPIAGRAQGFVILQNRTGVDGDVEITAWDDEGTAYAPFSVTLPADTVFAFNTRDLELGNADKGMPGIGDGQGNWRLSVRSRLDIAVKPYARVPGGFVTALGDKAPATGYGQSAYRVDFLNPASNLSARSYLRLVNPHATANAVTITAVDALGVEGESPVTLTLEPRAAVQLSAVDLEEGSDLTAGILGNGAGKWRLTVTGDKTLHILSLLHAPATGHLTNLSR